MNHLIISVFEKKLKQINIHFISYLQKLKNGKLQFVLLNPIIKYGNVKKECMI
jgi:hypothetical protein